MRFYEVTYFNDDGEEPYTREYFVRKDDAIKAAKKDGKSTSSVFVVEIDPREVGGVKQALLRALNRKFPVYHSITD